MSLRRVGVVREKPLGDERLVRLERGVVGYSWLVGFVIWAPQPGHTHFRYGTPKKCLFVFRYGLREQHLVTSKLMWSSLSHLRHTSSGTDGCQTSAFFTTRNSPLSMRFS